MIDNLTIRKLDNAYIVITAVSKVIKFEGTKKECEKYVETY